MGGLGAALTTIRQLTPLPSCGRAGRRAGPVRGHVREQVDHGSVCAARSRATSRRGVKPSTRGTRILLVQRRGRHASSGRPRRPSSARAAQGGDSRLQLGLASRRGDPAGRAKRQTSIGDFIHGAASSILLRTTSKGTPRSPCAWNEVRPPGAKARFDSMRWFRASSPLAASALPDAHTDAPTRISRAGAQPMKGSSRADASGVRELVRMTSTDFLDCGRRSRGGLTHRGHQPVEVRLPVSVIAMAIEEYRYPSRTRDAHLR